MSDLIDLDSLDLSDFELSDLEELNAEPIPAAKEEKRTPSFKEDLEIGKKYEQEYLDLKKGAIKFSDTLAYDFVSATTGAGIELKSDTYDMNETPNFFIERYSREGIDGGPWQSLSKGAKIFIYWFPKNKISYVFYLDKLVKFLDEIIKKYHLKLVDIKNNNYTTQGYLIKREYLNKVLAKKENFNIVKKEIEDEETEEVVTDGKVYDVNNLMGRFLRDKRG